MTALVIAEHDGQALQGATLNAVTAAAQLGEVHMLVAGANCADAAKAAAATAGVAKVLLAQDDIYAHNLPENLTPLIAGLADNYGHLLAGATSFGKNVMPRVAATLDVAQISEIIAIESEDIFQRPIYAGNAIATVKSSDAARVITVRATAFDAAETGAGTA
ncbi:MAG: electron transfer flavoprotein subunit alpha/FixB family protein, partial [Rhodospirillales bacterium]|nr:electron transfer flavoprotein subunit alpha/FixB family protein [Rhodospirillales bacterium]